MDGGTAKGEKGAANAAGHLGLDFLCRQHPVLRAVTPDVDLYNKELDPLTPPSPNKQR